MILKEHACQPGKLYILRIFNYFKRELKCPSPLSQKKKTIEKCCNCFCKRKLWTYLKVFILFFIKEKEYQTVIRIVKLLKNWDCGVFVRIWNLLSWFIFIYYPEYILLLNFFPPKSKEKTTKARCIFLFFNGYNELIVL